MTTKAESRKASRLTTPEYRVSFPSVFESKAITPGAKAKFSVQMLFRVSGTPKNGEKIVSIEPLKEAVRACLTEKYGDRTKWPKNLQLPFRNGVEKDYDGYGEGIVFVGASSVMRPGVVGPDVQPIITPNEFYGGCFAIATINPYAWEYMGKCGVSFGLQNIQKTRDGEPFSGRNKPEDDFDAIEAPAALVGAGAGSAAVGAGAGKVDELGV